VRIAFFTNRDIYGCMVLNLLRPTLSEHETWVGYSEHVGSHATTLLPMLDVLRFHEQTLPYEILFPKLEAAGLAAQGPWLTFNQLVRQNGWQATAIQDLAQPGLFTALQAFAPDLCISVRFGKIFKDSWLTLAPHGILNLHSGLLPEYRGVLATFWTLLQQRSEYGCTLHWINDNSIDTGLIIETIRLPVMPAKALFSHIASLYEPGAEAIARAIKQVAAGESPPGKVQQGKPQYFSYPQAEDCRRFLSQGGSVIDYSDYARLIDRFGPSIEQRETP
jgi:methionyl-tRNA formyltransferase